MSIRRRRPDLFFKIETTYGKGPPRPEVNRALLRTGEPPEPLTPPEVIQAAADLIARARRRSPTS